jgi:hypothetical protein
MFWTLFDITNAGLVVGIGLFAFAILLSLRDAA